MLSTDTDLVTTIQTAIVEAIPGAEVTVNPGSPGHYAISVVSSAFEGQTPVKQQRLVYAAIAHLMSGEAAPVHAIDQLQNRTP